MRCHCVSGVGTSDGGDGTDVALPKLGEFALRNRIWLERGGAPCIGRGKARLLAAIDQHGSLSKAARSAEISYRAAWKWLEGLNTALGAAVVETSTGGASGGGSTLTQEGRALLESFKAIDRLWCELSGLLEVSAVPLVGLSEKLGDAATDQFEMLARAVLFHGHLCRGILHGVKMSLAARERMNELALWEEESISVVVESERCFVDGVIAATWITPGKQRLQFEDYGKMAATFMNPLEERGVRVVMREHARDRLNRRLQQVSSSEQKGAVQHAILLATPVSELYSIAPVRVKRRESSKMGPVLCRSCNEMIFGGRETKTGGEPLCRACAAGAYYEGWS